MPKLIHNAVSLSKVLIAEMAGDVKVAADLTVGNGHDALFILTQFPNLNSLLAMDIQEDALVRTRELLKSHDRFDCVQLVCDGHQHVENYLEPNATLDLVLCNLGYLPGVNKHITTMTQTTVSAIKTTLSRLTPKGGLLSIVCYPGHAEGMLEYEALQLFLAGLDQKQFNIMHSQFINQVNHPPVSILIQKR